MIIIEGLDGVGKSTVVEKIKEYGFVNLHYDYDKNNPHLIKKYLSILTNSNLDKCVADRSFFSELVYGPVLRGGSRISEEEFISLLMEYAKIGAKVIYLTSDKDILLQRRKEDRSDFEMISCYYEMLNDQYNKTMNLAAKHLPVLHIDTSKKNIDQTFQQCKDFIFGESYERHL